MCEFKGQPGSPLGSQDPGPARAPLWDGADTAGKQSGHRVTDWGEGSWSWQHSGGQAAWVRPWLCHLPAVWPQASGLPSLSLGLLANCST